MKIFALMSMLALLTSCFEKPIDVRNFYFPLKTINYDLVNPADSEDRVNIDVSVMTVKPEVIWVIKSYKKLNTKTIEEYKIGEEDIIKTSHKVDGAETLATPLSFKRMIKTGDQFGPRNDAIFGQYSKEPVRECLLTWVNLTNKSVLGIKLPGKQSTTLLVEDGSEEYCEGLGLGSLKLGETVYILDAKKLTTNCTEDGKNYGPKSQGFECRF